MKRPTPDEIRAALDPGTLPEPPVDLGERIKRQIPPQIPRREAPAPWGRSDWFRLAATLVLVAGGVAAGYRLALWMKAPSGGGGGTVARLQPASGSRFPILGMDQPVQAVPASYTSTREAPRSVLGTQLAPFPVEEARRYLERGELPPSEAVPPLAWAGYFDSGNLDAGDELVLEGGPSPFHADPSYRLLRVAVETPAPPTPPRPPMELTVMLEMHGAHGGLQEVERSVRQAAAGLRPNDCLRLVIEAGQDAGKGPDGEVRVKERQEFIFIGETAGSQPPPGEPVRRLIRVTRSPGALTWVTAGDDDREGEGHGIILHKPAPPAAPVPPLPPEPAGAPPAPPAMVVGPSDLQATLRETVRELAGGREVEVEFDPGVVVQYRLVGQGRPAAGRAGHDRMVALYEIKLAPGAPEDAVVAALKLTEGDASGVRSLKLRRAELAASLEQASAGLKAAALSAQWSAAAMGKTGVHEEEARRLVEEARRLVKEKVLMERQVKELQAMAEIAARNAGSPAP